MKTLLITAMTLAFAFSANAQDERSVAKYNPANVKLALEGKDPVSFFSEEGPVEGSTEIQEDYQGVLYRFASEENKTIFLENPNKYESTYGGWCAWAMVDGGKVPIDTRFYSFDFDDEGEKIRIHFFFALRAMQNFHNRRAVRGKNSVEIAELMEAEVSKASKPITETARSFQANADGNWKSISDEDPRFSNGSN